MMKNKKGNISAFITTAFLTGFLIFVFVMIFGAGGGFKTAFNLGKLVAAVPVWVWLVIAVVYLLSQMRK